MLLILKLELILIYINLNDIIISIFLQKLEEEPNLETAQKIGLEDNEFDDNATTSSNAIGSDYNVIPQVHMPYIPYIHKLGTILIYLIYLIGILKIITWSYIKKL